MLTSVELMDVPAQPTLSVRLEAAPDALGPALGAALARVMNHVLAQGAGARAPFVRRVRRTADRVEVLAGVCLAAPVEAAGELELGQLPKARVARALYQGRYADLDEGHRALLSWARDHGLAAAGPPWEIHLTGPTDVSDDAHAEAQLYLPVRPAQTT